METDNVFSQLEPPSRTMPKQKPGRSEQVVATPPEFIYAVRQRLGINEFAWDLAANLKNSVAQYFYTDEIVGKDALDENNSWVKDDWCWLNPPYADIAPWVKKAYKESQNGAYIAMLVPSSTGSNWWASWVDGKAYITFLNGRITFVGHKSPYPKDLVLLLYAPFLSGGSTVWTWK